MAAPRNNPAKRRFWPWALLLFLLLAAMLLAIRSTWRGEVVGQPPGTNVRDLDPDPGKPPAPGLPGP